MYTKAIDSIPAQKLVKEDSQLAKFIRARIKRRRPCPGHIVHSPNRKHNRKAAARLKAMQKDWSLMIDRVGSKISPDAYHKPGSMKVYA